jgi:hypothetical protein
LIFAAILIPAILLFIHGKYVIASAWILIVLVVLETL